MSGGLGSGLWVAKHGPSPDRWRGQGRPAGLGWASEDWLEANEASWSTCAWSTHAVERSFPSGCSMQREAEARSRGNDGSRARGRWRVTGAAQVMEGRRIWRGSGLAASVLRRPRSTSEGLVSLAERRGRQRPRWNRGRRRPWAGEERRADQRHGEDADPAGAALGMRW